MPSKLSFEDRILAMTDEVIAWNKPPGLATTGRDLQDPDCAQFLAIEYAGKMVWAVHQIDRDTSGVVLFARKKSAVADWQDSWSTGSIRKYYAALVHGRLPESPCLIDAPLQRLERRGYTRVAVDEAGKLATTRVHQLSFNDHYGLVLASPITGRTHQIRAHLQHIGCPLIGETRYNSIPCAHHDRHALHALAMTTDRPAPLDRIEAPWPDDLQQAAQKLDIDTEPLAQWASHT